VIGQEGKKPGVVAPACNPNTQEAAGQEDSVLFQASLGHSESLQSVSSKTFC
jgi:hypothetical protein